MELTRRTGLDAAHVGKSIWTRSHCGIFIGGRSRGEQAEQGAPILVDVCWRRTPAWYCARQHNTTALHYACIMKHFNIAEKLLELGADPELETPVCRVDAMSLCVDLRLMYFNLFSMAQNH
jgi:hypothetical protein